MIWEGLVSNELYKEITFMIFLHGDTQVKETIMSIPNTYKQKLPF
jgi:hypothetical protein